MPDTGGILELLLSGSEEVWGPAAVSLKCAALAALLSAPPGLLLGLLVGVRGGRWARPQRAILDAGLAVPTTAIALVVYLLLSRRGWFGEAGLLYSTTAIVIGEALVALPVLMILTADAGAALDPRVHWTARTLGASPARRLLWYALEVRGTLLAAVLSAFGRAAGELGVALILGGNIRGKTRTLTTAITLETSKGEYERAVALGILLVVFALVIIVTVRLAAPRKAGG
jgi:tungstate transport system permease protein